jgi:hypothetical protein
MLPDGGDDWEEANVRQERPGYVCGQNKKERLLVRKYHDIFSTTLAFVHKCQAGGGGGGCPFASNHIMQSLNGGQAFMM